MNIGEILRQAREEMGFSEKEVADDLQIPLKFIVSFERGEWAKLPARVYSRGFIKKYADYLELQSEEVLKEFDEEWTRTMPPEIPESVPLRMSEKNPLSFVNRQHLLILMFVAAVFVEADRAVFDIQYLFDI